MILAVIASTFLGSGACEAQATERPPLTVDSVDPGSSENSAVAPPDWSRPGEPASLAAPAAQPGATDADVPVVDPFAVTTVTSGNSGVAFTRQPTSNVPRLELRGIVWSESNDRIGLLQVGNEGVYMVREGDTVSLRTGRGAGNTVLSIKEISKIAVLVETGVLGEVIIVR